MAHVSDEDKAKMRRVAADLALAETDEQPGVEETKRLRAAQGDDPDDDPPEEGFYRRALALGMVRSRR